MLNNPFDHPPAPVPDQEEKKRLNLRDTLRLPALRQAQDRRRGFAPLHTPLFISLLVLGPPVREQTTRYADKQKRSTGATDAVTVEPSSGLPRSVSSKNRATTQRPWAPALRLSATPRTGREDASTRPSLQSPSHGFTLVHCAAEDGIHQPNRRPRKYSMGQNRVQLNIAAPS